MLINTTLRGGFPFFVRSVLVYTTEMPRDFWWILYRSFCRATGIVVRVM
jgi:hypothetical protein